MPTGDLNGDGIVNAVDLSILVSRWGTNDPIANLSGSGIVGANDLSILVSNWGASSGGSVLMVTEEDEAGDGNVALRDLLQAHGYNVIMRGLDEVEDYAGIDVVVVSRPGGQDLGQYLHPPVGIVAIDSAVRLGMGESAAWSSTSSLEVVDPASPLAGGATGTFNPFTDTATIVWETSTLPLAANIVVTRPSAPNDKVIYSYEAGSSMVTRFSTTRHVYIGYNRNGLAILSDEAQAQIIAAIEWAKESSFVAPPAPSTPTNLQATAGDEQISLSWTASVGAMTYSVKRSITSGGPYSTIHSELAGTGYTDTGLTNDTTYYYVVSAVNDIGESTNSNQVSATPGAPELPSEITHGTELTLDDVGLIDASVLTTVQGPIVSTYDGEVIENLVIMYDDSQSDTAALVIQHANVTVRNVRILAGGPAKCLQVRWEGLGATIEHCELDGMSPNYSHGGVPGRPGNFGNEGFVVSSTSVMIRRCHIKGTRTSQLFRFGAQVVENWFEDPHINNSGVSTAALSYRGSTTTNPPWTYVARNHVVAGTSGGVQLYPVHGPCRNISVADNLIVGVGNGFGLYGGRLFDHYCSNQDINIEGNRFSGAFAWPDVIGEGTNAGVDLSRPGNTFIDNQWLPGHGTIIGDLPARCGVNQDACEGNCS